MNKNPNENLEGFKFKGEVDKYAPMGDKLKPVNEMEIADLTDETQVQEVIKYLSELNRDPEVKKLQKAKSPNHSVADNQKMFMEDPAGTYIKKDGNRVTVSQYMKNKNSSNTRDNFNFQKEGDPRFDKGNPNAQKIAPDNYNSMVFNTKKVK